MKRKALIIITCLLSLVVVLALSACSVKININEKETEVPTIEVSDVETPAEEAPTEAAPAASTDVHLVSDDTHFVMAKNGVILSYEYEDDDVIGCKGYVDAGSEEAARITAEAFDPSVDATIESVTTQGSYVVITFTEKAFHGLTVSALEDIYEEEQITE
ncbi:MAG: hypothetical protein IKR99_05735 [Lachnospiraceae bacterium]|nr:hypothetical protein [Lachnospiraceae bacterium]MBR6357640.1 hypothetical protein [Lachnospiraceae bacterium]